MIIDEIEGCPEDVVPSQAALAVSAGKAENKAESNDEKKDEKIKEYKELKKKDKVKVSEPKMKTPYDKAKFYVNKLKYRFSPPALSCISYTLRCSIILPRPASSEAGSVKNCTRG